MVVAINEQREQPPYVTFEERLVEDRNATQEAGYRITKSTDWVVIRKRGEKDTSEKLVSDWFPYIRQQQWPSSWIDGYTTQYKRWKEGFEPVPDGASIREWAAINKQQADLLISAGVLTVEDMSLANEHTLTRIGLGARVLKEKAQTWLATAKNTGAATEQLLAYKTEREQLQEMVSKLRARVVSLEAELAELRGEPARTARIIEDAEAVKAKQSQPDFM